MNTSKSDYQLPDLSARQLIIATLIVALVALGFWLLFRFHQVILILMAGIILSLAMKPVVARLKAIGLPPGLSVALIYSVIAVGGVLFIRFGAPLIGSQAGKIGEQLSDGYSTIRENLDKTPNLLIQQVANSLPETLSLPSSPPADAAAAPAADSAEGAPTALDQARRYAGIGFKGLYQAAAIVLIAFFWTLESDRIKRSAVSLLPINRRDSVRDLFDEIEERVSGYIIGQSLLSLIIGGLSMIAYFIIGLPYAFFLGVFVGIMEFIPLVGPLLGAVPALIIGLSISPLTALWVLLAALVIHQLESNVFGPRVMKRTLDMRPLVTLLALTAFGSLFGILGALVALPLAAVIQLLFGRYVEAQSQPNPTAARDRVGLARYETRDLIDDVHKLIRNAREEHPDEQRETQMVQDQIETIATDLDSFLAQYGQLQEAE